MKRILIIFGLLVLFTTVTLAQETRFFMPKEIKAAYDNGTRSYDGKPGAKYWHNTVDYDIEVEVTPATRELVGSEKVVFNNNSPDDLNRIVVRLYHDNFRKGNARGSRVRESDVNDGVVISNLMVDGLAINMDEQIRRSGTNMTILLENSIKANSSATIELDWKMVIPETTIRTGAYDSTSYFVAYWYPQVAVYDDIFGWDYLSYDFSTEFYNNLGNFNVTIKAPESFTVMATGVLQNPEEVFKPEKLELYKKANSSEETVMIVSPDDINNGFEHQSGTWVYKADEVSDFSFCLSDHFVWDAAIQKVEDRNVLINSYYNINVAPRAGQLTQIQRTTMKSFSEEVPGVPYPYPEFTTNVAGRGGGGMETPMMAINGGPGRGVTIHEMFHTYFPMYVRTNEKRYAWMDEGWADFNTSYTSKRAFDNDTSLMVFGMASIQNTMGSTSDLPLITSTQFMDNSNYGYASYPLPAFIYSMLHHHLGEDMLRKCYRTYINDWAKLSPTPYDFFYSFENTSGQDLSWLWKPWFFNYGNAGVAIESFEKGKLTVSTKETRPVPLVVTAEYEDGTEYTVDFSADIWKSTKTFEVEIPKHKKVTSIAVNSGITDSQIFDNYYPPLKDRYKGFTLNENYLGVYAINEYSITADISFDDGLLSLATAGIKTYLLPNGEGQFVSIDKNINAQIEEGESGVNIVLELKNYGITVTGSKK